MRLLDLFCGAGGAAMGYHQAGFDEIVGIDIVPQPNYPFTFIQGDALWLEWAGIGDFDLIHASPPCQAHTAMQTMWNAKDHVDLIPATRELLRNSGRAYVIENVEGAPLENPIRLCGSSFGLGVEAGEWRQLRRHRLFETSFSAFSLPCQHSGPTIGLYGDHARDRRRNDRKGSRGVDFPDRDKLRLGREAMGMPWAGKWRELSEAIPPAYTKFLGEQFLAQRTCTQP